MHSAACAASPPAPAKRRAQRHPHGYGRLVHVWPEWGEGQGATGDLSGSSLPRRTSTREAAPGDRDPGRLMVQVYACKGRRLPARPSCKSHGLDGTRAWANYCDTSTSHVSPWLLPLCPYFECLCPRGPDVALSFATSLWSMVTTPSHACSLARLQSADWSRGGGTPPRGTLRTLQSAC